MQGDISERHHAAVSCYPARERVHVNANGAANPHQTGQRALVQCTVERAQADPECLGGILRIRWRSP